MKLNSISQFADFNGQYGEFGGSFVPEILHETLVELQTEFDKLKAEKSFWKRYCRTLKTYANRPSPLYYAENLSNYFNGVKIYLKREDLVHTGAHKINNAVGQGMLAKRLGKTRVIAETGAGQHGVATATVCAKLGLTCRIYMGGKDYIRQRPNVLWMEKMGAEVVSVESGSAILKDAISEALRDWSASMESSHYLLGTACGPHPFPEMVAWFQSVIGKEARIQIESLEPALPSAVYACVGGGSNALGLFQGFLDDDSIRLYAVEAGGKGPVENAIRLSGDRASIGIAQGYCTLFVQSEDGQLEDTHSIAAGLDYVGVSPIIAHLSREKKILHCSASDSEVLESVEMLMQNEGIIPALESAHAFAAAFRDLSNGLYASGDTIIINLSGRGDKDVFNIAEAFEDPAWKSFIKLKASNLK